MTVIARDDVTLALVTDVASTAHYFQLKASTASAPTVPTVYPAPSPWVTTEPTYTEGATNSLYTVDVTVFSDGSFDYTPVSLSSSYEAAKSAYNKAQQAQSTATTAQTAANLALQNSPEILADPTFTQKWGKWINKNTANANVYFDASTGDLILDPNANVSPWAVLVTTPNLSGTTPVGHDRTYRISCDVRAPWGGTDTIFYVSPANGMNLQIPTSGLSKTDYTHFETDVTLKANTVLDANTAIAIWTPGDAGIALSNVHVRDITEAKAAQKAADDAQSAATAAQTTADGKNRIFSSASEPSHTGIVPGDMWFQLDSNQNVSGIQVWNGSAFTDMVLLANELLVASSVGTTQIADNAITTGKIAANAVTAINIAAQTITGDKLDVGSVAAAIITSGLFKTSDGRYGFDSTNGFWAGDTSGMHLALTEDSNGASKLAIMHGTDVISSLSFVDTISTDGYVHTGISTGQNGQFLEFATLVDHVNHQADSLSYGVRLVAAGGTGLMNIDAQNAVNVNGTWFARNLASLPESPNIAGGMGTIGFAGGVKYVFNGAGAWVNPTDLVSMLGHGQWYNDYTYQMSGEIIGRTCFLTIRIVRTAVDWTSNPWTSAQILTIPNQYKPLVSDVNIPAVGVWGWGFNITSSGISVRPFLQGTFGKNAFLSATLSWQF